ncbi:MAG: AGE family epimerase/isomerase [Pyrinomonadaceae bacterium]
MKSRPAFILLLIILLAAPVAVSNSGAQANYARPGRETYLKLAEEAEEMLRRDVLGVWFPRTVDTEHGGFRSNFTRDWQPAPSEGKFSVFQGRMTWVAAQVAVRRPDLRAQFLPIARDGFHYLNDVMWDREAGGFYWGLDDAGRVTPRYTDGKHLYGMSFCLYGAAAVYKATRDPAALALARRAFRWMDAHAHDARHGGYFEWLTRDGRVVEGAGGKGRVEVIPVSGFPLGYKSMNTHLHLLESFTELYGVWKDETLRRRLEELLAIVRDRVSVEPGAMNLYFTNDWRALPGHDSYGHDVEAAYLMLEASEALGRKDDPATARMAKMLVDHALAYGWDETYGGFYREGTAAGEPEDTKKEWWAQAEGLNTLLLMHERYGRETDAYFKAFRRQWEFLRDRQVDKEFRGLYDTVGRDGTPTDTPKARIWKAAYHDGRALLNVTERLRRLAAH